MPMMQDNIKRKKLKKIPLSVLGYIFGATICIIMIFPFYFMVISSFKTMSEYTAAVPTLIPTKISLEGYQLVFSNMKVFGRMFLNSLTVSIVIPILQTIVCLPCAYALSRLNFVGKKFIFILLICAMMFPGQLTIIQNFSTMTQLKLINNLMSVILLGIYSSGAIFMMRQYLLSLPKELEEAAKIDGCGTFRSFLYIIAPLSLPVVTTNLVLCFNGVWGDFFGPMLLLRNKESMTLPVGMKYIMGQLGNSTPTANLAALTIMCVPVIIFFFVFRKKLISGIANTGLKM